MDVPWEYERCILCLKDTPLTEEHIIPKQIGGKLSVRFLCKPCNDRLGHEVEPTVKNDPAIRFAVEHLKPQIPELAKLILDGQPYVGHGQGGTVRGRFKSGVFQVDSHRKDDGSVVQSGLDGRKHIAKVLRKAGHAEETVASVLNRLDAGPDNQILPFAPGRAAIRWRIDRLEPVTDGPSLSEQALLKIAYEFAALHLADKAYDESPKLAALRTAVSSPAQGAEAFSIEYLTTREYMPVHGLSLAGQSPHVAVTVCLFGWLVFRVHLRRIAIAPPYFKYTLLLDTGERAMRAARREGR